MIFDVGYGQARPWFLRTYEFNSDDMKKINGDTVQEGNRKSLPRIRTADDMKRLEQEQEAKAKELGIDNSRSSMRVLTPSEAEEHDKQQRLYMKKFSLTGANTEFWDGMTEEQQWAFIDTFDSISSSTTSLYSSPLAWDENVVAAVYGQNLAKIDKADSILKGHHADKLMEALEYHQTYLEKEISGNPWLDHIDHNSESFKRIAGLFAHTGNIIDTDEYNNEYNKAINVLSAEVGDKFSSPAMFGGVYSGYLGFIVNDWNSFISNLVLHGVGQELSNYSHKGIDTRV